MKEKLSSSLSIKNFGLMVLVALGIAAFAAAINGGTALTTSSFDPIVTWLKGLLSSSFVIMMACIVLVWAIWTLAHGGGYKAVSIVLGVLAVALIGPGLVTTVSTAMPEYTVTAPAHASAPAAASVLATTMRANR